MSKGRKITANSFTKIDQHVTDSARYGGPDEKIPPPPGTNRIAGFVERAEKKINGVYNSQMFFASRAVLKLGEYPSGRPIDQSRASESI